MKTDTRNKLVDIIRAQGPTRPVELARRLEISPQALHRQLRSLVSSGVLVANGSPPLTRYALAGVPDFSAAFEWISAPSLKTSPKDRVCETRDVFAGRLSPFKSLVRQGLDNDALPLLVAAVGEVGNNSFDHNLGQWRDVPGCWLETQVTGDKLWICIADRGRGIFNSLINVVPDLSNDEVALRIAFEKIISGRAPERRGNGLKFVRNIINDGSQGLGCISGKGSIHLGKRGVDCAQVIDSAVTEVNGTLTLLVWGLR